MVNLRSEEVGLAVDQLAEVEASYTELLALRETLGDRPFEIRLTAQTELRSGELTMSGDVTPALESLSALPAAVLADFDFAEEVVASSSAELLDDFSADSNSHRLEVRPPGEVPVKRIRFLPELADRDLHFHSPSSFGRSNSCD